MSATHAPAPPATCASWLGVAFWKKPLHLLASEELHGHGGGGGGARSRESPSSDSEDSSSTSTSVSAPREIERTLELFDLIMIGIGGTVGAGVFATAGLIANVYAGPAAILSWLIAGIGCILSGFSFMELSCLIPSAGSTYAYAYHALGELPAMFAGFLLTLEYGVSSAGGARSWSDKFTNWLETEWQITGPEWMKPKDSTVDLYAGLLMSMCVVIVLCGMQAGKRLINIVTMTKISVVLFIIVVGFLKFDAANITPFIPPQEATPTGQVVFGWPGVFLGASASFFGYIGYDEVCCLAGEAKNPTHNIPRAVIGTIVGAAVLSTLATFSLVGMQRYTDIDAGESYGKAFESVGWRWAATIVSTGEVLTMPITTFIGFMAQPRVQYAMAKDGLLPRVFARLDKNGNLFHSTALCGVFVVAIATLIPFKILWDFISLGILVAFNLTNASLLLVRGARLRDVAGSPQSAQLYSHLLLSFLVTSFLAAFHWQKSVVAPVVITSANRETASHFQLYMHAYGPAVASMSSVFALASVCGLKYVEVSTPQPSVVRQTTNHNNKHTVNGSGSGSDNEILLPSFAKGGCSSSAKDPEAMTVRRLHTTAPFTVNGDEDEEEKEYCDPPGYGELELGQHQHQHQQLRRNKSRDKLTMAKDNNDDDDDDATTMANSDSDLHTRGSDTSDNDSNDSHPAKTSKRKAAKAAAALAARAVAPLEQEDDNGKPLTFQAPLVPFTPCIAIFFNWFLFAQMDASSVVLIALWLLLALAIYVSYSVHHSLARQQLTYHRLSCS